MFALKEAKKCLTVLKKWCELLNLHLKLCVYNFLEFLVGTAVSSYSIPFFHYLSKYEDSPNLAKMTDWLHHLTINRIMEIRVHCMFLTRQSNVKIHLFSF